MLTLLKDWKGSVEADGRVYSSIADLPKLDTNAEIHIILTPTNYKAENEPNMKSESGSDTVYQIKVKQYMTKKASPEFNFMSQWNNDIPMPMRVMVGTVEKETKGMVYMKLHGDLLATITPCCMKCGRPITNKISQYFGMGPECGGHNYTSPFETEEELQKAVADYKAQLHKVTWEGWIIKSAIEEQKRL